MVFKMDSKSDLNTTFKLLIFIGEWPLDKVANLFHFGLHRNLLFLLLI